MKTRKLRDDETRQLQRIIADKTKTRKESEKAQVILLLDRRYPSQEIEMLTGYKRSQAFLLRRRFLQEGVKCLGDKRKGKPKELLTKRQRQEILETVSTKKPKDIGKYYENYDFWTTSVLGHWIERTYGVEYKSKTSLYLVFRQARFSYHKPARVYDKYDAERVKAWKEENEKKVKEIFENKEKSKYKDAVLLCADEMILTTETTLQKVWLPQGEFPKIVCSTGGRRRRNVYGFLNMKTGKEHAFKTTLQNMYVTRDVLKEIRKIYPKQKIVLFWDNAGWHKGSVVQEWIEKKDKNIEQVWFPPYSPDENPQEHVWKSGREHCTHNEFIEDIDKATDRLIEHFNETKFSYSFFGRSPIS